MVSLVRKIPLSDYISFIIPIGVIVLVGLLIGLMRLLYPYEPYVFYGFTTVPSEVCPRERIDVYLDREIRDGYNIKVIEIKSEWVAVDVSDPSVRPGQGQVSGTAVLYDPEPRPREVVESPVKRSAPNEPGEWNIRSTVEIRGSALNLPRTQTMVLESATPVKVLSPDSTECEGE